MEIPKTHQTIMPYLMLADARAFSGFVQAVFDARETFTRKRENDEQKLMHGELQIGGSTIMFCDTNHERAPQTANLFVYVPNADSTYKRALEKGADSIMEPADQSYGRSCGVKDPAGNTWWITSVQNI